MKKSELVLHIQKYCKANEKKFDGTLDSMLNKMLYFISKGMEYDIIENPTSLDLEIKSTHDQVVKSIFNIIVSSQWFEENGNIEFSEGNSIVIINYLTSIDLYEQVLKQAEKDNDKPMMNFYYKKITDLQTALSELL